jgi:hypothetical protein
MIAVLARQPALELGKRYVLFCAIVQFLHGPTREAMKDIFQFVLTKKDKESSKCSVLSSLYLIAGGGELYGLPKLHKEPIVDRPIISGIGSITEGISKIADYYMKKIIPHAPTHL